MTEKQEVEAAIRKSWARKYPSDEVPSCELLRAKLRLYIRFLRGQVEALGHPITRSGTLVLPIPVPAPEYPGETVLDVLCDVEEFGKVGKRLAKKRNRA